MVVLMRVASMLVVCPAVVEGVLVAATAAVPATLALPPLRMLVLIVILELVLVLSRPHESRGQILWLL